MNGFIGNKIYRVEEVKLSKEDSNPQKLIIKAKGTVPSTGWSEGFLVPYVYIDPPADGIYDFDFLGIAPSGPVGEAILPINAEYIWEDFPSSMKGVRIHSSSNNVQVIH